MINVDTNDSKTKSKTLIYLIPCWICKPIHKGTSGRASQYRSVSTKNNLNMIYDRVSTHSDIK